MIYGNMKEHKYEVEGIEPQIMTEVATLLHICCEKGLFTKDDIYKIAEMATKSTDELKTDCDEQMKNDPISKFLDKVIDDASKGNKAAADLLNNLLDAMLKQ